MQWLKVTAPDGEQVWLTASACSRVRSAHGVHTKATSIIDGAFGIQAVTETVDQIMRAMRESQHD